MEKELIERGLDTSHLEFIREELKNLIQNFRGNKKNILHHLCSLGIKFKESPTRQAFRPSL
jgi:hypothetical protein